MLSVVSEPRTNPPRRLWRRLLRAMLACVIALALLATAAWFFIVPEMARQRIDALLRQYEPDHRHFEIGSIGLSRLTLRNMELGRDLWLRAERVDVRYRFGELLKGRVIDIEMRDFEWRVAADRDGIRWGFTLPPRTSSAPQAMPFDAVTLRDGRLLLDAAGQSIVVPFDASAIADSSGGLRGDVTSHDVLVEGEMVPGFEASFTYDGSWLRADAGWPLITTVPLTAAIDIDFSGESTAGTIDVTQPAFALESAPLIKSLWPAFGEIESAGRASVDARFSLAGGRTQPRITLRGDDVSLADVNWPLAIVSATGTVVLDSLSPLSTDGPQRIRVDSATSGELDINTGQLDFELDESGLLQVQGARWFMNDGGHYEASPATIDLAQPRIATTISCDNVDLDFWLRLLTGDRADGQGRLQGQIAVDWNPRAKPRIQFTAGSLTAVPPTGYVRIHDAPAIDELLEQADPRFGIDERLRTVKDRIIAALEDLGYTNLQLGFVPDGRDTILRAELQGKGRRGEKPQEFSGLVINIGHFAASLQSVLDKYSAVDRMRDLRIRPRRPAIPTAGAPQDATP